MGLRNFPTPVSATGIVVAIVFVALMIGAIFFEFLRQRVQRRRRIERAWQVLDKIEKERDLTQDERRLLSEIIGRFAPTDPLQAVTVHAQFSACVDAEMKRLKGKGDGSEYERTGVALRDIRSKLGLDFVSLGQRIESTRDLGSPQQVWVSRASDSPPRWARGNVAVVNEAFFSIVPDKGDGESWPRVAAGDDCKFRLYRDEDARYSFTAPYIRTDSETGASVFHHTANLNRIQSRDHYRVRHEQSTDIAILEVSPEGEGAAKVVGRARGTVTNISAGGFALVALQQVQNNAYIRVTISLGLEGVEAFETAARVVGASPLPGGRYLVRASFIGLPDDRREAIARFVILRQTSHHDAAAATGS